MRKRCFQCGKRKATAAFSKHRSRADGLQANCKACQSSRDRRADSAAYYARTKDAQRPKRRAYGKAYYRANKATINAKVVVLNRIRRRAYPLAYNAAKRARFAALRVAAIQALGGACPCGEQDLVVLQIDHVHGGGTQELKRMCHETWYRAIARGEPPSPVQVLCANCNRIKSWAPSKNADTAQMKRRALARAKLGDACKRCGFAHPGALQIDHVNSDGASERSAGPDTLARRVLEDTAGRYQLLCASCNWRKKVTTPAENPKRRAA